MDRLHHTLEGRKSTRLATHTYTGRGVEIRHSYTLRGCRTSPALVLPRVGIRPRIPIKSAEHSCRRSARLKHRSSCVYGPLLTACFSSRAFKASCGPWISDLRLFGVHRPLPGARGHHQSRGRRNYRSHREKRVLGSSRALRIRHGGFPKSAIRKSERVRLRSPAVMSRRLGEGAQPTPRKE